MANDFQYVATDLPSNDELIQAVQQFREPYFSWNDEKSLALIKLRMKHQELFNRRKGSAIIGYQNIAEEVGIGRANYPSVKKKWENLVDKFRQELKRSMSNDLENAATGSQISTWKFYWVMGEALGMEKERQRLVMNVACGKEVRARSSTSRIPAVSNVPQPAGDNKDTPLTTTIKIEHPDLEFDTMFDDQSNIAPDPLLMDTPEFMSLGSTCLESEHERTCCTIKSASPCSLRSQLARTAAEREASQPWEMHSSIEESDASSVQSEDESSTNNKIPRKSRRGKKRRQGGEYDVWKLIVQGNEAIRQDLKELIKIQKQTSDHIGTLVTYLINKDKKNK